MRYFKGSLFDSESTALGHGVNTVGVMGAGIALQFKRRYPVNFDVYHRDCQSGDLLPGQTLVVSDRGKDIFNIASQRLPGRSATYERLFSSALDAARQASDLGHKSIAIPEIGCGIGGLKWQSAKYVLMAIEKIVDDFEWEVWRLT